jgi:hypothetical protein
MHRSMALAIGLLAALPAFAQQTPNDVSTLNKYAGTYAVDCSKPGTTRLTVGVKALALQSGTRRLQTAAPMAAFSYFGNSPPPNYDVALLGEAPPTGLAFIAMNDETGPYLTVEADQPLEKQFGKAALAGKFRRCP